MDWSEESGQKSGGILRETCLVRILIWEILDSREEVGLWQVQRSMTYLQVDKHHIVFYRYFVTLLNKKYTKRRCEL